MKYTLEILRRGYFIMLKWHSQKHRAINKTVSHWWTMRSFELSERVLWETLVNTEEQWNRWTDRIESKQESVLIVLRWYEGSNFCYRSENRTYLANVKLLTTVLVKLACFNVIMVGVVMLQYDSLGTFIDKYIIYLSIRYIIIFTS